MGRLATTPDNAGDDEPTPVVVPGAHVWGEAGRPLYTFTARRYRLSAERSSITVIAPASIDIGYDQHGTPRVHFLHGPDHALTAEWLEGLAGQRWVVIDMWQQPRTPPSPEDGLWLHLTVDAQVNRVSMSGFAAQRPGMPDTGDLLRRSDPPRVAGVRAV